MSGSTFGKLFRITTWGESHGKAIGAVVDGCPAGLPLCEADIQTFLDRRKPGQSKFTTARRESDQVEILSGVFAGKTTGTPISLAVFNSDQHSGDYDHIASIYRPGHADYTFSKKYGFRDYRGGGRTSGRETAGRVAGGAIAALVLKELGIRLKTFSKAIGTICIPESEYCLDDIYQNRLYMPGSSYAALAEAYLEEMISNQDSCGGVVECIATGLPTGLGEPVFDKLDACLAQALMSIGAVKAVEVGDGMQSALSYGSQNNDAFIMSDGKVRKKTNHSGGILGGLSDGAPLIVRAGIKPTPSISKTQQTVTMDGQDTEISIRGRHDPIIVPRAVVVVESMVALTLTDLLLQNMGCKMDSLKKLYLEDNV